MASNRGKRRFALRTIRNGRVRILGDYYEPSREPTPELFEGMRAAFGLYWGPPSWGRYDERGLMDGVCLWGSEKAYHAVNDPSDDDEVHDWPGPFCENGYFKWESWRRVVQRDL